MEKSSGLIERLQDKVEEHIQVAVSHFQNLDREVLLRPSHEGGWSIAQCLDHLNSYGHFYLPHIKHALLSREKAEPAEYTRSSWTGRLFIKMMDPANTKKYKAINRHVPSPQPDAYATVAEFIQQQETLLSCLEEAKRTRLDAIKVPVSLSRLIRLNLGDALQFVIVHNERHVEQAKRNLMI